MRISASLIVRDEEQYLDECLQHLNPVVDEVVIVDTGSVDQSPQIALNHGAKLIHRAWDDDFAAARNTGLDACSGDWVLYIDADEQFLVDDSLHAMLEPDNAIAAGVRFRAARGLTPYREHRLFRNRPEIRFTSPIHETVMPAIRRIAGAEGASIIEIDAAIEHYGYEGDLTHKHERNHPILLRALREDPERVFLWHALGECELGLGNPVEAECAWRNGLQSARLLPGRPGNVLIYADLLDLHFNEPGLALPETGGLIREMTDYHPKDPLTLWWSAQYALRGGDADNARLLLQQLLEYGPLGPEVGAIGYDRRLFNEWPCGLMGTASMQVGEVTTALDWFDRALESNPSNIEIATKRQLALARKAS